MNTNDWTYQGKPFTSADIGEYTGFVYEVCCLTNGKKYIGQKRFESTITEEKLRAGVAAAEKESGRKVCDMTPEEVAARTKKVKVTKESNWANYYGSNASIKADVKEFGKENFTRTILELADAPKKRLTSQLNRIEVQWQLKTDCVPRDDYYNDALCQIRAKYSANGWTLDDRQKINEAAGLRAPAPRISTPKAVVKSMMGVDHKEAAMRRIWGDDYEKMKEAHENKSNSL